MVVYAYNYSFLQLCSLIGTVSQVSYVTNGPLVFMLSITYQRIIAMMFSTDSSLFKLKEWHCLLYNPEFSFESDVKSTTKEKN